MIHVSGTCSRSQLSGFHPPRTRLLLHNCRLEHVSATTPQVAFLLDRLVEVEEGWDGNLRATVGLVNSRDISALDPTCQGRMADPEKSRGQTLRHRCAQLVLKRVAHDRNVPIVGSGARDALESHDVLE